MSSPSTTPDDSTLRIILDPPESVSESAPGSPAPAIRKPKKLPRLVSLDAFRGFIMFLLAAHGLGISRLASTAEDSPLWKVLDRERMDWIAFHFRHPPWQSSFVPGIHDATLGHPWLHVGVGFWDLIQPAFMFMVGVALPFSLASRASTGQTPFQRGRHALIRSVVLVLMGVFLYSVNTQKTNWIFSNVLGQIGLGYFFVYLLTNRRLWLQVLAFCSILVGTWCIVHLTPPPQDYQPEQVNVQREQGEIFAPPYRQWSKNGNAFSTFDKWFLNLFPRSPDQGKFEFNWGGYQTLNFIPSMATMLLGVFCGQILLSPRTGSRKFFLLVLLAILLWGLGVAAGATCCPVIKRLWTPSWVLFSGGYVVGMLALFYLLFDLLPLQFLAKPLIIIGMNSLLVYFLGELLTGWLAQNVLRHFGFVLETVLGWAANTFHLLRSLGTPPEDAGHVMVELFSPMINAISAVVVIWLICYWLYRQRIFLRV